MGESANAANKSGAWRRVVIERSAQLIRSLVAEAVQRIAIRELERLDDRILADLGVPRAEIEFAVRSGRPARPAAIEHQPVQARTLLRERNAS